MPLNRRARVKYNRKRHVFEWERNHMKKEQKCYDTMTLDGDRTGKNIGRKNNETWFTIRESRLEKLKKKT